MSRVSLTAFARVRRSLRDGFGHDYLVLEAGDFTLAVGIELDDISLDQYRVSRGRRPRRRPGVFPGGFGGGVLRST